MEHQYEIKRSQLAEQIYENLRRMLEADAFNVGDRLVESDLAKRLEVSRTPIREALFRLEADGLIEQRRGKFVIARLRRRDIREIFELRRVLEPYVVADLATRITDAGLERFLSARDAVVQAKDTDEAIKANTAFRELWMGEIHNRRLSETLQKFHDQVGVVRRATLVDPQARAVAKKGVCDLVDAFSKRDADAARRAMVQFVDDALTFFEAAADKMERENDSKLTI